MLGQSVPSVRSLNVRRHLRHGIAKMVLFQLAEPKLFRRSRHSLMADASPRKRTTSRVWEQQPWKCCLCEDPAENRVNIKLIITFLSDSPSNNRGRRRKVNIDNHWSRRGGSQSYLPTECETADPLGHM